MSNTQGTQGTTGAYDPNNGVRRSMDTVRDELGEVRQTAGEVGARLKEAGAQAVSGVADKVKLEAGHKVDQATGSINRIAEELDRAASNCSENEEWASKVFAAGATSLKEASGYLSTHRIEDIMHEAESFARRNPLAYLGATVAAGFLLSRVGKTAAARAAELVRRDDGEDGAYRSADYNATGYPGEWS